jgi:uncharacterized protein
MPHLRTRYIMDKILERLKFFPVVAIQGARQVGKSALVRDLLPHSIKVFRYETFDQPSIFQFAKSNPESFLESAVVTPGTLAIDEAQKVPEIFDAVKYRVDKKRIPGQFILLGSTEFSKRTLIRESLAGRMGMVRLFPFTLAESLQFPNVIEESALSIKTQARVSREVLMRYLANGGMPGAFHIRDSSTRDIFFKEWIGLIVLRDLMLIPKVKLDPNLATTILEQIATNDVPSIGQIAKVLKTDPRRIRTHIECLEALFVLHKILPEPSSSGQPLYYLCDVGLASYLGANFERRLQTWAYQELLAHAEWRKDIREKIFYYRSPKGSCLDFVLEGQRGKTAIKIIAKESVTALDIKLLESYRKKNSETPVNLIALGPTHRVFKDQKVTMVPWECLV